jgi:hypothetical protein
VHADNVLFVAGAAAIPSSPTHTVDPGFGSGTEPRAHAKAAHVSESAQQSASEHADVAHVTMAAVATSVRPALHAEKPAHVAVAVQQPSAASHSLDAQ